VTEQVSEPATFGGGLDGEREFEGSEGLLEVGEAEG
jgi:hypothetical protein